MIDLRPHYRREAERAMRLAALRLRRRQGVGGRKLVSKDRADGRPLGGSVARDLRRGKVTVSQGGFVVDYAQLKNVVRFNDGNPSRGQPARRVIGLTDKERREIFLRSRDEAARQLNAGVS